MTALLRLYPGDHALALAAILAVEIAVVVMLTWLVARLTARRDAATRHGLWLAALVGVCLAPALVFAVDRAGVAFARLPWPAPAHREAVERHVAEPRPAPVSVQTSGAEGGLSLESHQRELEPSEAIAGPPRPARARSSTPLATATSPAERLRVIVAGASLVWALGVAWLIVRLFVGWVAIARVVRSARRLALDDPDLLLEAARAAGLRRPPGLAESNVTVGPVATGILHPLILLPANLLQEETGLREVLIHECAHLARRDPLVGLLQSLVEALFWPHPLVHLLNRELSRAREEVCDNYVLARGDRVRFARTLVDLSESLAGAPRSRLAMLGLLAGHRNLAERVASLLDDRRLPILRSRLTIVCAQSVAIVSLVAFAAGLRPAQADLATAAAPSTDEKPQPKPAPEIDIIHIEPDEVAGRVVDTAGKPIVGVEISVLGGLPGYQTHTDAHGKFRFSIEWRTPEQRKSGGKIQHPEAFFLQLRFQKAGFSPVFTLDKRAGTANWVVTMTDKTYFEGQVTDRQGKPVAGAQIRADQGPKSALAPIGYFLPSILTETKSGGDGRYRLYLAPDTYKIDVRVPGVGVAHIDDAKISAEESKTLDIALVKGVSFQVRVVDESTAKPVKGVRLKGRYWPEIDATSDEGGRITFVDMIPGVFEFLVEAPGYARWSSGDEARTAEQQFLRPVTFPTENRKGIAFDIQNGRDPVLIEVEPEVIIRGRIVDPDGKPVAGATIRPVVSRDAPSGGLVQQPTLSGPEGRYEMHLPASKRGTYSLQARESGPRDARNWADGVFPPFLSSPGQVLEDYDIALTRPATVRGRVLDAEGKPIAGRQVAALDAAGHGSAPSSIAQSDSDGKYELKLVPPGEHFIQVSPYLLPLSQAPKGSTERVLLQPGEVKEGVDLVPATPGGAPAQAALAAPAAPREDARPEKPAGELDVARVNDDEIAGRVVDTEGKPIEGVEVDAYSVRPGNETRTDAQGRFRLNVDSRPPEYRQGSRFSFDRDRFLDVRFRKEGYSPVLSLDKKPGTVNWVVTMGDKTYFEGRVTEPQGKPVADALVRADQGPKEPNRGYVIPAIWTETKSGPDGRYRLYVAPDAYKIQVRVPGVGVAQLPQIDIAENEAKALDIALEQGANFHAKMIHSETGKPVPNVHLVAMRGVGLEARADENGVLALNDMVPGTLEFRVVAPGFGRWWSEHGATRRDRENVDQRTGWQENSNGIAFEMKPGMEPVTIVLEPEAIIRGRITDPDGKPVEGAMPQAVITGSGRTAFILSTIPRPPSGADGRFELHVPASKAGSYSLYASDGRANTPRKWAAGVFPAIITNPGQVVEDCDIQLTRPAIVRGRVVDAEGKPIAGRQVRAGDADGSGGLFISSTKTDREGKFELRFVRPGPQFVQVSPFVRSIDDARPGAGQTITLKPGEVREGVNLVGRPLDR